MRVLACDPGYTNLGLAALEIEPDHDARVVWSATLRVGTKNNPGRWAASLISELNDIDAAYGPFDGFATEAPPYIQRQIQVTALLWHVVGIIRAWSIISGVPEIHEVTPNAIKRACAATLTKAFDPRFQPSKPEIGLAVAQLTGQDSKGRTNHENDAALAGIVAFGGRLIPDATKAKARA